MYFGFSDPDHVKRERRKAQELRKSSWWKQQVGPGRCYHCGEKFAKEVLTLDHVIPLSRGGKSTKNNCVPACKPCNAEKGHLFSVEKTLLQMEADRLAAELARADQFPEPSGFTAGHDVDTNDNMSLASAENSSPDSSRSSAENSARSSHPVIYRLIPE